MKFSPEGAPPQAESAIPALGSFRAKITIKSKGMQLFYAPDFTPPRYTLSEEESKHCIRVLRLGEGDSLHITDGRGDLFHCRITDAHPKRCEVEVVGCTHGYGKRPCRLTMAVAP